MLGKAASGLHIRVEKGEGLVFEAGPENSQAFDPKYLSSPPHPHPCLSQGARDEVKRVTLLLTGNQEVQA